MPTIECPKCKGTGGLPDGSLVGAVLWGFKGRKCDLCGGTGYIKDHDVLEIRHQIGSNYCVSGEDYQSSPLERRLRENRERLDASKREMDIKIAELTARRERKLKDYFLALETGNDFFKGGKYDQAICCYTEATKMEMSDYELSVAWVLIGRSLKAIGHHSEAEIAFAKAKRLGYTDPP